MPEQKVKSESTHAEEGSTEQKAVSESAESDGVSEQEILSVEETQGLDVDYKYYLRGLAFLLLILLTAGVVAALYLRLHNINVLELFSRPQKELSFGYIGGDKNPASIMMEIWVWCLLGVNCRLAYLSGRSVIRKRFRFLRYLTLWFSTWLFAQGVAVAVILSLQVISLNIASVEISLANASIETIIALSFILGFYHDDARRLLGSLRGRIVTGMEGDLGDEE
jgi:hypothetical protein